MASSLKSLLGGSGGVPVGGAVDVLDTDATNAPVAIYLKDGASVFLRGGSGLVPGTAYEDFLTPRVGMGSPELGMPVLSDHTGNLMALTVAAGAGAVVVAGYQWPHDYLVSLDGGNTWSYGDFTDKSVPYTNIYSMCFAAGQFVMLVSGTAYTSPDGKTWTKRGVVFANPDFGRVVVHDGTAFIAGSNTGAISRSTDAITWTPVTSPITGTRFLIGVSGGGTTLLTTNDKRLIRSTDGTNWTVVTYPFGADYGYVLAYGGAKFLAAFGSDSVSRSSDGLTWTVETAVTGAGYFNTCAYLGGSWYVVGAGGHLYKAFNGGTLAWTDVGVFPGDTTGSGASVANGDSGLVIVGSNSDIVLIDNNAAVRIPPLVANGYARYVRIK